MEYSCFGYYSGEYVDQVMCDNDRKIEKLQDEIDELMFDKEDLIEYILERSILPSRLAKYPLEELTNFEGDHYGFYDREKLSKLIGKERMNVYIKKRYNAIWGK